MGNWLTKKGAGWRRPPDQTVTGRGALFGGGRQRAHGDLHAVVGAALERHVAVDERKDRVVAAEADIGAGLHLGAALAHDDVAGNDGFAAELLHAETAALGIAAV